MSGTDVAPSPDDSKSAAALELVPVDNGAALPDPPVRMGRRLIELELMYDRGELRMGHVRERCLASPVASERRLGHYAIEIGIGRELIDRARFDFPLLAVQESVEAAPLHRPALFAPGARSVVRVGILASERAVWARLVDRRTRRVAELRWPPDVPRARCDDPPR